MGQIDAGNINNGRSSDRDSDSVGEDGINPASANSCVPAYTK